MAEKTTETNMLALAGAAARSMTLGDITLVKSDLTRAPEMPSSEDVELKLDFGFKVEHSYKEGEKHLAAFVRFFAKGEFVENDETNELFVVQAAYVLQYDLDSDEPLPTEMVAAFAQLNGVYNAWPYWREYVQTSTTRMGLPPATLPLITAVQILSLLKEQNTPEVEEKKPRTSKRKVIKSDG